MGLKQGSTKMKIERKELFRKEIFNVAEALDYIDAFCFHGKKIIIGWQHYWAIELKFPNKKWLSQRVLDCPVEMLEIKNKKIYIHVL